VALIEDEPLGCFHELILATRVPMHVPMTCGTAVNLLKVKIWLPDMDSNHD
jgi:hypothetical protein